MQLSTFWTALSLAGTALCDSYKVYLRDIDANGGVQTPRPESSTILNARQAQILLAYRSGVTDNEDLGAVDVSTLALLNDINGADDLLDSTALSRRRLYIFDDESSWSQYANWQPQFEVSEPLESLQSSDLLRQHGIHATSIKELDEHTNTPTHLTILVRSAHSAPAPLIEQTPLLKRTTLDDPFSLSEINSSSNSTSRTLALLPTCFKELSFCQQQTNNCSGHGECYLRYTNKDATTDRTQCYACRCSAGNGTSAWAGAACQKKDISVPFWLLSGFTVTIVAAVVAGVGMLYSVGESELPSVLGAGVPPTRK